jgi:PKD domain
MSQKIFRGTASLILALVFVFGTTMRAQAAPPANDNFADATIISTLPFDDTLDTSDATIEAGEPTSMCGDYYPIAESVWYAFTPAADGMYSVSIPTAAFRPGLTIFTGSSLTDLTEVHCIFYTNSRMLFHVNAGTTYYFQASKPNVWEPDGSMQFHLEEVPPPANDAFADAKIIASPLYNDSVDTTAATVEAGEPLPSCAYYGEISRSVWYAFTPATGGSVSASIPGAAFIPLLAVYTGSSLSGLTELGCQYDENRLLTFHANAGTTYYFQVGHLSPWQMSGNMQFTLEVAPAPIAAFYFYPGNPSIYDTLQFYDQSYDPGNTGFQSWAWNFGDGATSSDAQSAHLYKADGDYAVQLTVTTSDGRTASASQVLQVRTHDVAITKITAPLTAKAGQAQKIIIAVKNRHYAENVQVDLYKTVPGGFQWVGAYTQYVPVRMGNQTSTFTFNYTFTADDAKLGKVSFKAVATIVGYQDVLPTDNELISSPPTRVTR